MTDSLRTDELRRYRDNESVDKVGVQQAADYGSPAFDHQSGDPLPGQYGEDNPPRQKAVKFAAGYCKLCSSLLEFCRSDPGGCARTDEQRLSSSTIPVVLQQFAVGWSA